MDQGSLGKIGSKVDEAQSSTKIEPGKTDSRSAAATPGGNETVNLTSSAKLLERLDKTLASLPVVDQQRVDEIKTAISNGDYQIDARAVADAMVRFDRSFGE